MYRARESTSTERKLTPPPGYAERDPYEDDRSPRSHRPKSSSFSVGLPQTVTPTGSLRGRPPNLILAQTISDPNVTPQLTPKRRAIEKLDKIQRERKQQERQHLADQMRMENRESTIAGMKSLIPMTMAPDDDDGGIASSMSYGANKPYSIDTDPLLQDNKDFEKAGPRWFPAAYCTGILCHKPRSCLEDHGWNIPRWLHYLLRLCYCIQPVWSDRTLCVYWAGTYLLGLPSNQDTIWQSYTKTRD